MTAIYENWMQMKVQEMKGAYSGNYNTVIKPEVEIGIY